MYTGIFHFGLMAGKKPACHKLGKNQYQLDAYLAQKRTKNSRRR
jgi:hypothetical protein